MLVTRRAYSWTAHQLEIGMLLGRRHNYVDPISNLRPFLNYSAQTTRDKILDFLVPVAARRCFPVFLVRALKIELNN